MSRGGEGETEMKIAAWEILEQHCALLIRPVSKNVVHLNINLFHCEMENIGLLQGE